MDMSRGVLLDKPKENKPQIRLLYCRTCNTVEELPAYDGPEPYNPKFDPLLEISVQKHQYPSGLPHMGDLFVVDIDVYVKAKREILKQIKGGSKGLGELDESYYDTRSTFHEDAMKCFQQHLRPKGQCPDYMSDSKILLPDTKAERKELGFTAPKDLGGPKVKLCQFCPVHVYNVTKAREERGLYK